MPVVAAAVCPHPPLIVPEVAAGAAEELADLRAACDAAVAGLLAATPQALVVVGPAERSGWLPPGAQGSFAPYGVSIEVAHPSVTADAVGGARLPLSLTVGAWLLGRAPCQVPVAALAVAADAGAAECARLGADVAGRAERVALLVMGDGSARRGPKAPGYDDPRASPYDDGVARALATADVAALRGLDPGLSAELMVAGRAAWQVLASAADGAAWRADLTYHAAPYGVAYFVAGWERA